MVTRWPVMAVILIRLLFAGGGAADSSCDGLSWSTAQESGMQETDH